MLLAVAALSSVAASAADDAGAPAPEAPRVLDPGDAGIGGLVPDVTYVDVAGRAGRLSDARGAPLVVVARSVRCPLCRRWGPVLADMVRTWTARGVRFLVVDVAAADSPDDVRQDREKTGIDAPFVVDADGRIAAALGIRSTTEVLVLDAARTLVYRGAIDDRMGLGYARADAQRTYLADAVEALLAGRRPDVEATSAPGCVVAPRAAAPVADAPTWHGRVSRIVARHCGGCHRDGEAAPFPLQTLADVRANAPTVRREVARGAMPPWPADPAHSLPLADDRRLPPGDRDALLAWLGADCPEGDPADAPLPVVRADGWSIGEPDLVVGPETDFEVPATGVVPYRYEVVTTELDEDRWVQAFEIRPSAPQAVHHVLVFAHYPAGHPRVDEQPQEHNGLDGFFAAMVPGENAFRFPPGTGRFLPRGARLRFQIHYTPTGEACRDRPRLGLVFTQGRPRDEVLSDAAFDTRFRIPPGARDVAVSATRRFERGGRLLALTPHMHLRGAAFRFDLELPDGSVTRLLDVPRFDFQWQFSYRLREPLEVPRGAVLRATGVFDNSAENPANPDPRRTVRFGEQTTDEMMIGYFEWVPAAEEEGR